MNQTYAVTARNKDTGEFVEVITNSSKVNAAVEKMRRSSNLENVSVKEVQENPLKRAYIPGGLWVVTWRDPRWDASVPSYEWRTSSEIKAENRAAKLRRAGYEVHVEPPKENPISDGALLGLAALGAAAVAGVIYYMTRPKPAATTGTLTGVSYTPTPGNGTHTVTLTKGATLTINPPTGASSLAANTGGSGVLSATTPGLPIGIGTAVTAVALATGVTTVSISWTDSAGAMQTDNLVVTVQ